MGKSIKHYPTDGGLKKIKKMSSTKPRQKNIVIPHSENDDDNWGDYAEEDCLLTTDN